MLILQIYSIVFIVMVIISIIGALLENEINLKEAIVCLILLIPVTLYIVLK